MRILIVTGIFPPDRGGPASYVPRISAALARRGHAVEVVCLSDTLLHDDVAAYPFRVQRIRRRQFWPWRIVLTMLTIWRAALRHDLVYVNGLGAEAAVASFLAARPSVYKIVGDHAWERAVGRGWFRGTLDEYQENAKSPAFRLLSWVRTFPLQLAEEVIVPSRYLQRIVMGWGIPAQKVRRIFNAVSLAKSDAANPRTLPAWSGSTLITVCRLVPWKGVDALIRLLPELPGIRLVIAGDGSERSELAALAQNSGVAERVLFLGDVPQNEVGHCIKQADAFVLNSTYEGLPHVVLEAMAAGVPVIATDAGGTGEVVENGVTGLLVPVADPVALKAAVERMMGDASLRQQLAAEATARLRADFIFEAMVESTEAVLLRAVERTPLTDAVAMGEAP